MKIYFKQYMFIVLLFSVFRSYSQFDTNISEKSRKSISASYQYGNIIPTTNFLKGDNLIGRPIDTYQSLTVNMLWQNPGKTDWQKVFRAPYYGLGVSISDLYDSCELGYPISLFGVFGIPIKRWNKLELYTEGQFGLAVNWKYYDPLCNPKNVNIGAGFSFHLNAGLNAYYPISKKLDIGAGMSFIHFSNGGIERPNKGLNIFGARTLLRYHIDDKVQRESIKLPGRLKRSNDLFFTVRGSRFQYIETELSEDYYGLGGFSMIYFTQFSNAFRLGYGADFDCWKLLNSLPGDDVSRKGIKKSLGVVVHPELIISRLTLVGGLGIYACHEKFGSFKQLYERLGVRYELCKNMSVGLNLRARDFYRAEYMEFNLGYRIMWMK